MAHEVKANGGFTNFHLKGKKFYSAPSLEGIYHRNDFHITRYLDLEGGRLGGEEDSTIELSLEAALVLALDRLSGCLPFFFLNSHSSCVCIVSCMTLRGLF